MIFLLIFFLRVMISEWFVQCAGGSCVRSAKPRTKCKKAYQRFNSHQCSDGILAAFVLLLLLWFPVLIIQHSTATTNIIIPAAIVGPLHCIYTSCWHAGVFRTVHALVWKHTTAVVGISHTGLGSLFGEGEGGMHTCSVTLSVVDSSDEFFEFLYFRRRTSRKCSR